MVKSFALSTIALGAIHFAMPAVAQDSEESEFTVGVAYPVIESSYDVQPQIQKSTADPHPYVIPIHKIPGDRPEGNFNPRDRKAKKYIGFDGTSQTPWSPPDPTIATGPNHVVETVNMNVAWWRKDGTLEFSQRLDGNTGFFGSVGAGGFTFDPKCYYDTHDDRYVIIVLEFYSGSGESYITVAVSDDSDPNGTWFKYRTDSVTTVGGSQYWVDYPGVGGDADAMYVTGNLFGFNGGFAGAKYRSFRKSDLINGLPVTFFDLRSGSSASVQVADREGAGGAYFASVEDSNEIKIQTILNPITSPALRTIDVGVNSFGSPPNGPTLGGGDIDTLDGRIINAFVRNSRLVAGHGIGASGRAVARWYEFNIGNWPNSGSVSVAQQGNVDLGAGIYTFFPALAINGAGDIGLCMARTASAEAPSIWYTRNEIGDPAGSMQPARELRGGVTGASGRWGDYFDIALDPSDDTTFWGCGEYANNSGWATWIGTLDFDDTPPPSCPPQCTDPSNYGSGAAGTGGIVPTIAAEGCPTVGNSNYALVADNFLDGAGGICFIGLGTDNVPGGGWTLWVDPALSLPVVYSGGSASISVSIPNNPFLDGVPFYAQFIANDPGAPQGISASDGLESIICGQ